MASGSCQHVPGLLGGVGHTGLGQYMLALIQRGQGQRAVHVGPGPDADGVDAFVFQQFLPAAVNLGDVELVRHGAARFDAPISHGHDLQIIDLLKPGNVPVAHVPTCAYETHPNMLLGHESPPYRFPGRPYHVLPGEMAVG